jgi:hypothetical protein
LTPFERAPTLEHAFARSIGFISRRWDQNPAVRLIARQCGRQHPIYFLPPGLGQIAIDNREQHLAEHPRGLAKDPRWKFVSAGARFRIHVHFLNAVSA